MLSGWAVTLTVGATLVAIPMNVQAQVINAYENYDPATYNGNIPAPGQPPNDAFGRPIQLIEPGRRLQFGVTYSF